MNNLSGPLSSDVAQLMSLQVLWLSLNQLQGTLPASLGALSSLQTL